MAILMATLRINVNVKIDFPRRSSIRVATRIKLSSGERFLSEEPTWTEMEIVARGQ